jgi:Cu/Ag efflux pump CusA
MARVVIGGLVSSTLITLVVVPTVYSYLKAGFAKKKLQHESQARVSEVNP